MPTETILGLVAVLSMFGFFATTLIYADMTWDRQTARRR